MDSDNPRVTGPFRLGLVALAVWLGCSLVLGVPPGIAATAKQLPAQTPPPANQVTPIITDPEAMHFVADFWGKREHALATNDVAAGSALLNGVAGEWDLAVSRDNRIRHLKGLRTERPASAINVVVPLQTSYPASFLAEVLTTLYQEPGETQNYPYLEMMVFTRRREAAPWKLTVDTGYTHSEGLGPTRAVSEVDFHTLAPDDTLEPVSWVSLRDVHADLAAYWQHWLDEKSAPSPDLFAPGDPTTGLGAALAKSDGRNDACGCRVDVTYRADVDRGGLWTFDVLDGRVDGSAEGTLACSTIRIDELTTPPVGTILVQDKKRENWGGLLRPGRYLDLTLHEVRQSCILVPPDGPPLRVFGRDGGLVGITGTRV